MHQMSGNDGDLRACDHGLRRTNVRRALMGATALAVLVIATPVIAQDATAAPAADNEDQTIVVTASRVGRTGFDAPTPTTILNAADVQRRAPNNVSEVLNDLPTFRATVSPLTQSLGTTNSGQTYLDLRGMGAQRTLTLVDGRRFVPSEAKGRVDVNNIPSSLIDNVQVVTGGASASWGSDAVAGVVNIILKKKLEGIEATAQTGVSGRGDDQNYNFSAAAGTGFNGGRGHILIGGEYTNDKGIGYKGFEKRLDWIHYRGQLQNPNWATNGLPAIIYSNNVQFSTQAPGGLITGPLPGASAAQVLAFNNSGLLGTIFNANGTTSQLQYGQVFGSNMIGGSQPRNNTAYLQPYIAPVERWNVMALLDYEISDALKVNLELSNAVSKADYTAGPNRDAGTLIARIDNPFLPTIVRDRMVAAGLSAVAVGRDGYDLNGNYEAITRVVSKNHNQRIVAGAEGDIGVGNWHWDAYYQYGRNTVSGLRDGSSGANRNKAKYALARDVVTNPANGQPICRSTLTDPTNGCVPFNIFGIGTASPAALAYVGGVSTDFTRSVQQVAALNFRGDLFNLPAGAISAAFGGEWRKEKLDQTADAITAAGGFELGTVVPLRGRLNVKETFGELVVPVLKDSALGQNLDLQLAARYTDYSTSGAVTTWKAGLTWKLNDDMTLRGAVSRDIRAGNMTELFTTQAISIISPLDTVQHIPVPAGLANQIAGGNPNLKPERATTYTAGVVLKPHWLHGFRLSVDYYNIEIKGVIGTIGFQTIIDRCALGLPLYCNQIVRNSDPANAYITKVNSTFLNLNRFRTNGLDFELLYSTRAPAFMPGNGNLVFRALATYTAKFATTDAVSTIDRAGQLGGFGVDAVPHWQGNATLTYSLPRFSTSLQGRFIQGGNINNLAKPGTSSSANIYTVPAVTYWSLSASYDILPPSNRQQIQIFANVNNLFDQNPPFPFLASSFVPGPYYDPIGRAFRIGIRIKR